MRTCPCCGLPDSVDYKKRFCATCSAERIRESNRRSRERKGLEARRVQEKVWRDAQRERREAGLPIRESWLFTLVVAQPWCGYNVGAAFEKYEFQETLRNNYFADGMVFQKAHKAGGYDYFEIVTERGQQKIKQVEKPVDAVLPSSRRPIKRGEDVMLGVVFGKIAGSVRVHKDTTLVGY